MKQFTIPSVYRSPLIAAIKKKRKEADKLKKDFSPTRLNFGPVEIILARHFGFCYGVENAIEIAFDTVEKNKDKRIFLLSEMIHNPFVNEDLLSKGVRFLMDTKGKTLIPFSELTKEDVVIIPAFGTTLDIENELRAIGIQIEQYNTTCPFVEKVWNRSEQIAKKGYSIVVHGKPSHEETRATFSHSDEHAPTLVINDMEEAIVLGEFVLSKREAHTFPDVFKGRYSKGFDCTRDLVRFGVVNQTTMLASDTQSIADYLRTVLMEKYGLNESTASSHFADTRDTLCYATNDNQTAVLSLMKEQADLAIVMGGRKSSNSSHLVELLEQQFPTYFIESHADIPSRQLIQGFNWRTHEAYERVDFLPANTPVRIAMTSGASCPDAVVEATIERLVSFFPGAQTLRSIQSEWE